MRALQALLALALLAGALVAAPANAAVMRQRGAPLASTGYILGGAPDSLVARDAHGLATLGVAQVSLNRDGRSLSGPDAGTTRLVGTAHANGLRAELLLSNYSDAFGDFDPKAAAKLLRHADRVRSVAAQLASIVAAQGWDGIQVDLESMSAKDADGLILLVQELQARMAPEKSVSIAVMASTDLGEYADRGYHLPELGQAVDTLALMTYDQHGPGWSGPGPIGARKWQLQALRTVVTQVPVAKVDLGVAGYGYTWPERGTGRSVTVKQARKMVARDGAKARWRKGPGEWTAKLSDGTRLWWSDGRSYALRLEMATAAGVHGLALWRLGSADPLP